MASGRIVRDGNVVRCKVCKHLSITHELHGAAVCPLCHAALPVSGGGAPGRGMSAKGGAMAQMYGAY